MSKPETNKVFKALADPTRREIFHLLVVAGMTMPITDICAHFEISRQGVTKHIKQLEGAGLISINDVGRENLCEANIEALKIVMDWLRFYDRFWDKKLTDLDKHLKRRKAD